GTFVGVAELRTSLAFRPFRGYTSRSVAEPATIPLAQETRLMSQNRRAMITALGRYVPPTVVTNEDLAKHVNTSHEWIVERTGIAERRVVERGTPTSELATRAA